MGSERGGEATGATGAFVGAAAAAAATVATAVLGVAGEHPAGSDAGGVAGVGTVDAAGAGTETTAGDEDVAAFVAALPGVPFVDELDEPTSSRPFTPQPAISAAAAKVVRRIGFIGGRE